MSLFLISYYEGVEKHTKAKLKRGLYSNHCVKFGF